MPALATVAVLPRALLTTMALDNVVFVAVDVGDDNGDNGKPPDHPETTMDEDESSSSVYFIVIAA